MARKVAHGWLFTGLSPRTTYMENPMLKEPYPRGHFYSPLPDLEWVSGHGESLFRKDIDIGDSVELREQEQFALLQQLASYYADFIFPEDPTGQTRYYTKNKMFGPGSGFSLYAMLRHFKPRQVIEAGSGFTSALMLDVNDQYLGGEMALTLIEPNPKRLYSLLRGEDHARCRILTVPVQEVPAPTFDALDVNDILFIDGSHVAKIGSDVNYLLFGVLPRLRAGVLIHIHDIYWPFEYPEHWIMSGKAWNEAYIIRAFLQYNNRFEILQFNNFLVHRFEEFYRQHLPIVFGDPGTSLWLRKR